jgi:hypothetical protein
MVLVVHLPRFLLRKPRVITIDAIARNMEEGDQTDIILLDFAKAFDKVPHDRLLHKIEFYHH